MSTLQHKIDFVALVTVTKANCNGDPLDGNRPRCDYSGYGEISDVCIKRKIRNRMQDMGYPIFVQSEDRCTDGCKSLAERAKKVLDGLNDDEKAKKACETWLDVRTFGQLFAYEGKEGKDGKPKKGSGLSIGVRGPVSIHQAVSVSPIEIESMQITKSVNGNAVNKGENDSGKKAADRMGMKHFVRFGLYEIKGSINVQLAKKTGFSEEDAQVVKECLCTLFENDASAARPDGSMEVRKIFWWEHNCEIGQYSSAQVHRSVRVTSATDTPSCFEDYEIDEKALHSLPGLEPQILVGR